MPVRPRYRAHAGRVVARISVRIMFDVWSYRARMPPKPRQARSDPSQPLGNLRLISIRALNEGSRIFHNHWESPYYVLSWLKKTISAFPSNTLLNRSLNMISTGCPKKNVVSWKNSHNYPQTHPKYKSWECFRKFRIFATRWALRFSKLKKKWPRKWSLKLPTPP